MTLDAQMDKARRAVSAGDLPLALTIADQAAQGFPDHAEAHDLLGGVRLLIGDATGAVAAFRRSLALRETAEVSSNLCMALMAAGDAEGAISAGRRAVDLDAGSVNARLNLTGALVSAERLEEALAVLQAAGGASPQIALNLGLVSQRLNRPDAALAAFRRAAALHPNWAKARRALAEGAKALGLTSEALQALDAACALSPKDGALHLQFGVELKAAGRLGEAISVLQRTLEIDPGSVAALNNLGLCLRDLNALPEALEVFQKALRLEPEDSVLLANAASVLQLLLRDAEAARFYRASLTRAPGTRPALLGLAGLATEAGAYAEAQERYDELLGLWPDSPEAQTGRGILAYKSGDLQTAEVHFAKALQLAPDWPEAVFSSALCLLKQGKFEEGWRRYAARLKLPGHALRHWAPRGRIWSGEDLAGRSILLRTEQGLGDLIQCARYIPLLIERGAEVRVETRAGLERLMQSLGARLADTPDAGPAPDFEQAFFSLPAFFGAPPLAKGYLRADAARVECWRRALPEAQRRIGLFWQGSTGSRVDQGRSLRLRALVEALKDKDAALVSLQKGLGIEQITADALPVAVLDPSSLSADLDYASGDMMETAALIEALDLVITCDTAVAHLAGALGKPVFILLATGSDWRWLQNRADSPWYASARLFRQKHPGDWSKPLAEMAAAVF